MTSPTQSETIPDEIVMTALNTVLKPLGTNLRHYMPVHRDEAIEAMRDVLIGAMRNGFTAGFAASGEGYNGEYPFEGIDLEADDGWRAMRERILLNTNHQSRPALLLSASAMPETDSLPSAVSGSHSAHRVPSKAKETA